MAITPKAADAPAPAVKTVNDDAQCLDIKKGDRVRLLQPIFDNVQLIPADTVIHWPFDAPPLKSVASYVEDKTTPLDAPAMTDGKPSDSYRDPVTNEKPIIGSV